MTPAAAALAATLTGFAVMSLELAAVRMFAPFFGDSALVWTNVIGAMLIALAVGAFVGGRLADPERCAPRLRNALLGAAALAAVVPLVAGPLGGWLMPPDLPLDRASQVLVRGSLTATLLAFAPPVLLAGAATPMLVTALAHRGVPVGRASGLIATWGTLGSLAGTFATTHLLVPELGSRATVWTCAALLVTAAFAVAPGRYGLAVLVPLALPWLPMGPMRAAQPPAELLAEVESPYQFLQVVRTPGADGAPASTALKINEGLDSFHSVRIEASPWTGGLYYDWHAAMPFLAGDGRRPDHLRVLSLGAAAGTFERIYAHAHPGCTVDSVEIDAAVVALGRAHFDAFAQGEHVHAGLDARVFVEHAQQTWDVVLVDAYERQVYLPAHLASVEFFRSVATRLNSGGVVSVNVGGRNFDDPVVEVLGATLAEVFGEAWAFRVPRSRNFVLAARIGAPLDPTLLADVSTDEVPPEEVELTALLQAMGRAESWHRFAADAGAEVLVDDRPFLDQVQDRALARQIDDPVPTAIRGSRAVDQVEIEALELARQGDWGAVVVSARTAREASGYLRFLLGDARWQQRDVAGALAEYRESTRLGVDADIQDALEARVEGAEGELAVAARADGVAARNGWLAAAGGLWVAGVAWAALRGLRS